MGAVLVLALAAASIWAVRWIRSDVTYWSRSVTFEHGAVPLATCLPRALPELPGVRIVGGAGAEIRLAVPGQEGALVKPADEPNVARIVVYGHSTSVSTLGPAEEVPIAVTLRRLKSAFSASCGSP